MKLMFTLAALLIATISTPAFADWDTVVSPANPLNTQQFEPAAQPVAAAIQANSAGLQWDTSALQNSQAAALANLAYLDQQAQLEAQREAQKRNYVKAHPVYATPNLNVTQFGRMASGGDYGAGNGTYYGNSSLPATTLDSIVIDSGMNDQIYGDEGTDGPPPSMTFSSIDSGMPGNLTTGHAGGVPTMW